MSHKNSMRFERYTSEKPSAQEQSSALFGRAQEALATLRAKITKDVAALRETYGFDAEDKEASSDTPTDTSRRRFMAAFAAGAVASALPKKAQALERIDPDSTGEQCEITELRKYTTAQVCDKDGKNCHTEYIDPRTGKSYTREEALRRSSSSAEHITSPPEVVSPEGGENAPSKESAGNAALEDVLPQEELHTEHPEVKESVHDIIAKSFYRDNEKGLQMHITMDMIDAMRRSTLYALNRHYRSWNDALKRMKPFLPDMLTTFKKHGVPVDMAFIVITESRFRDLVSHAGAQGHFQITEETAHQYGHAPGEVSDPLVGASIAARKLAHDYELYTGTKWTPGNYNDNWEDGWMLALAAYNGGYVNRWFQSRGKRPGTYKEYLAWLQDDINTRIIPNEQKKLGGTDDVEKLIKNLPMTLENLTYPAKVFGAMDYAVIQNIPELVEALRQ